MREKYNHRGTEAQRKARDDDSLTNILRDRLERIKDDNFVAYEVEETLSRLDAALANAQKRP